MTQVLQSFPDQTCPVAYSASKQKPQDDTNDLAIKAVRTFKEGEAWRHPDEANT